MKLHADKIDAAGGVAGGSNWSCTTMAATPTRRARDPSDPLRRRTARQKRPFCRRKGYFLPRLDRNFCDRTRCLRAAGFFTLMVPCLDPFPRTYRKTIFSAAYQLEQVRDRTKRRSEAKDYFSKLDTDCEMELKAAGALPINQYSFSFSPWGPRHD